MFSDADRLEADIAPAYQAWKAGPTPQTSGQFLKAVNPIIDSAMHSYGGGSAQSPTLRSRARRMALDSAKTYDPKRGTMRTHLLSQMQSLRRAGAQEQQIISRPELVGLHYQQLLTAENELGDQLGRAPSDLEIADFTGFSLKRLGHIRQSKLPLAEGTTERAGLDPGASQIPGQDDSAAWLDYVYTDLSPTDRTIMDHTLGRNGQPQMPTNAIARRLGITAGAVSQRSAKIQRLLDQRYDLGVL